MHEFNIQSSDWNQTSVSGIIRNLFRILKNIPTVVGIMHRGPDCEWKFYAWLIITDLHMGTKICCGWGGLCKFPILEESAIGWKIVQIILLFFINDLVGFLINIIITSDELLYHKNIQHIEYDPPPPPQWLVMHLSMCVYIILG